MALLNSACWRSLPFWAGLLPLVTFNLSYAIAALLEHVPACFTYLQGCTSVSSTGRLYPETVVFKAGVLAAAIALLLTWNRTAGFLQRSGESPGAANFLRVFAWLAGLSLAVYGITLGLPDVTYGPARRAAINGFAISNSLTQVAFLILYRPLHSEATRRIFRCLLILAVALVLVGVTSELAKALGSPRKMTNNIAAWNAFLLVSAYYFVLARLWRYHRISSGRTASPSE